MKGFLGFLGFLGFNAFTTGNYLWLLWFLSFVWFYYFKYLKGGWTNHIKGGSINVKYAFLMVLILVLFIVYVFSIIRSNPNVLTYKVGDCERGIKGNGIRLIDYDEQSKILNVEVWVNCCGVNIKVEKDGTTYKILEKQFGELCRCMCKRKVTVFNVSEEAKIDFLDKDGNSYILSPYLKFCGWSSYGKCNNNRDCIADGCSGQVCKSKFEEQMITSCEWLDCYDAKKFNVACKCIDGRCQWVRK